MTRALLEQTAVAAGRSDATNGAAQQSADHISTRSSPTSDVLSTACSELGDQLRSALEAADRLERAWLLLMANPVLRAAYQRYHGIYRITAFDGSGVSGQARGDQSCKPVTRCHERVSDLLGTLRALDKLGPAQWNSLARDYANLPAESAQRRESWFPTRHLRRFASALSRK